MYLPDGKATITVEGIIRWVNQAAKDCVCGIQLTEKLNEAEMAILKV
jgi:hypothetical protein